MEKNAERIFKNITSNFKVMFFELNKNRSSFFR